MGIAETPPAVQIKLYNSGNFFDTEAITPADYASIANLVKSFRTVIVECHPRLVGVSCLEFKSLLRPDLQLAMGLEIAHPDVLGKLNKRMTLVDFERAVAFLNKNDISIRAFILLNPPFLSEGKSVYWAKRSIDFAFDAGVECCVVIPTRPGNGALDQLKKEGLFIQPRIEAIEEVLAYGIGKKYGRVFADLWDIRQFSVCSVCTSQRIERLQSMNLFQKMMEPVQCDFCHNQ